MNYSIVINGLGHAFLREFGCPCARCRQEQHMANTSASIIATDEENGKIIWHALVDVGLGVVTSLCDLATPDDARLDWLLFTHWHPDHSLELNRLCETLRRRARLREESVTKLPTWCRRGTAGWLQKTHAYEWHRCIDARISDEAEPPGTILPPVPLGMPDLTVTPVSVSHYSADIDPGIFNDTVYASAAFVISTEGKKAVLLWDLDNTNDWIVNPSSDAHREAVGLLAQADYLFIDCFSWSVEEVRGCNTGHTAFTTVRHYAKALAPRETLLMHISGHEEGPHRRGWGWPDWKWQQEAQKCWRAEAIPGTVRVPVIGETFELYSDEINPKGAFCDGHENFS
jgi:ribonuclease BN (tRNA processing enzyme)